MRTIYDERFHGIIDVTKSPYCVDNTGKVDCTQRLNEIVDDILQDTIDATQKIYEKLVSIPDENIQIGFENRKRNGILNVIFPEDLPPRKIIYFPAGTYLVSDTISYSHENMYNMLGGLPGMELNTNIHFKGESKDSVVIKLQDNCKGFGFGDNRPVVSFMRAEKSNVAQGNTFEDITIDIGRGNSGAVGLVFFANNLGAVRNVRIVSSDEQLRGYAGLEIKHEIASGCYVKNLEVVGFDYGVRVTPLRHYVTLENVTLSHQKRTGIAVKNTLVSICNLHSDNEVQAVTVEGSSAHVVLVDAELRGGHPLRYAVEGKEGMLLLRNVDTSGYKGAILPAPKEVDGKTYIDEYSNHSGYSLFGEAHKTLNLPIEQPPELDWQWDETCAFVNEFGAVGDGKQDDTAAIQRAMNSGKKHIVFQPVTYFISDVITVPATVEGVHFMYADFIAGEKLRESNAGAFKLIGDSDTPLLMEDSFVWEKFYGNVHFIEQANKRTLILSDMHVQTAAMYFNTVEGSKVFIEDCGCTVGSYMDMTYRHMIPFSFVGQTVYARNINPERSMCEILNDHGTLWIMGFKAEFEGAFVKTINGGKTEVLGGVLSIGRKKDIPAIENVDSDTSFVMSNNGYSCNDIFPIVVKETRKGETRILPFEGLPRRLEHFFMLPLYAGRNSSNEPVTQEK